MPALQASFRKLTPRREDAKEDEEKEGRNARLADLRSTMIALHLAP
jgi:hypothetical protein